MVCRREGRAGRPPKADAERADGVSEIAADGVVAEEVELLNCNAASASSRAGDWRGKSGFDGSAPCCAAAN